MAINDRNIAGLLAKLNQAKINWQLAGDGAVFNTKMSLLQPVIAAGVKAMLKAPLHAEERRAFALMACWDGYGAAKVLRFNKDAILMERATGGTSLREMVIAGNEDEADRIICDVAARLHRSGCEKVDGLVPLTVWFRGLFSAADLHGGIFKQSAGLARALLDNQQDITALHGDIHYDNVLDSGNGDWVAIDPKALLGERAFDFANLFCNPTPEIATSPPRLQKQVKLIACAAGLDAKRLLQWIAAWGGLCASWTVEDGEDPNVPLTVAQNALNELAKF